MKDTGREKPIQKYVKELVTAGVEGSIPFRPSEETCHEPPNCLHKEQKMYL